MKKLFLLVMFMVSSFALMHAQEPIVVHVSDSPESMRLCYESNQQVVVYAQEGCSEFYWEINNVNHFENPIVINPQRGINFHVCYWGCEDFAHDFWIRYIDSNVPNDFTHTVWKRQAEMDTIAAVGHDSIDYPFMYEFLWSTGETTRTIEVTEPGTYTCTISELCGTATRTFIVRDNVEIYRSGVDPATNKNRVLWQTTPEQAAYISNVKVERDGMVVGTVPYLDGQFLDNIGSENAARIYRITAIASDGTECPIPSYQFGTFNTIYSPDIANPSLMNFSWEDPFIEEGSPYEVIAYRIGRVDNSGEFIVIDQLSANVHLGKYDMDLFDGDYGIVAAVFNDSKRDYEELAFSNRSDNEILNVDEQQIANFKVYPNPTSGAFTVEGSSNLTIYNMMGQVIATSFDENGVHTISIKTPGVYFVKSDEGTTQKVVIE